MALEPREAHPAQDAPAPEGPARSCSGPGHHARPSGAKAEVTVLVTGEASYTAKLSLKYLLYVSGFHTESATCQLPVFTLVEIHGKF